MVSELSTKKYPPFNYLDGSQQLTLLRGDSMAERVDKFYKIHSKNLDVAYREFFCH